MPRDLSRKHGMDNSSLTTMAMSRGHARALSICLCRLVQFACAYAGGGGGGGSFFLPQMVSFTIPY